jgi:uncharacterized protein YbjT (DUF2867 family)
MSNDHYVITGATGRIGRKLTEKLLAQNRKVRAVGRNLDKLKRLEKHGAEIFLGNVESAGHMSRAFTGAKAVFTMIPPNPSAEDFRAYQNRVSDAYALAIVRARVKFVVNLSSIGAHLGKGAGVVNGLHDNDERLNRLAGVNVMHLRPTFFMENLFFGLELIKRQGIHGGPFKPDLRLAMIATTDIAAEAAARLSVLDFKGQSVQELLGQRDLTMVEVSRVLGDAIGKPDLRYVQFPYEEAETALLAMGMSKDVASQMVELYQGTNEGLVKPTEPRSARNTTPTSIEEFAKEFAEAYRRQESPDEVFPGR